MSVGFTNHLYLESKKFILILKTFQLEWFLALLSGDVGGLLGSEL